MKSGIDLITEERKRQVESEGWTPEHDDQHSDEEIAQAAVVYATPQYVKVCQLPTYFGIDNNTSVPYMWPWDFKWYKPAKDGSKEERIKELTKAGALIAAEIDRLNRLKD